MGQTLPYIAIYPGDWLQSELESESLELQGLWLRMMFVMSRSENYGELVVNGAPMTDEFIAKKCRISSKKFKKYLKVLENIGVLKRKPNGVIYSGRMEKKRLELEQNRARQKKWYDEHEAKKLPEKEKPNGRLTGHARARHISSSNQVKEEEKKEITNVISKEKPTHIDSNDGAKFDFPIKEYFEAFPDAVLIMPAQIGMITAEVKASNQHDQEAWKNTLQIYKGNIDRANGKYLPERVGTLLSVFRTERKKLENSTNGTGGKSSGGNFPQKRSPGEIIANREYRRSDSD